MYKLLCAFILSLITLVPAFLAYKKSRDAFSPIAFYNLFMFISIVPRLALMDENSFTESLSDDTVTRYFLITAFGILMVNIFFMFFVKKLKALYLLNTSNMVHYDTYEKSGNKLSIVGIYVIFIIGAASKIYLILSSGGIRYIWANINQRTKMLAGNNYINSLEVLMIIACALIIEKFIYKKNNKYRVTLVVFVSLASLLLLSFGNRSGFVKLILLSFFVINYRYKHFDLIKIIKLKYFSILLLLILIIVMLPMVRHSDSSEIYRDPALWIMKGVENISNIFGTVSYVDRDMMTYDIFEGRDLWHGKSYLGIIYAWIPRGLFPDKPPVDDGVYLANLIYGFEVEPGMPYSQIIVHSSAPFSSFGIMYANFGIVGIIIGSFLLACVYFWLYKKMTLRGNDVGSVLIYGYLMLLFGLSTLSFLLLLIPGIVIWIVIGKKPFRVVFGRHKIKY